MITIQVRVEIPFRSFAGIALCPEWQGKGLVREDYVYDILLNYTFVFCAFYKCFISQQKGMTKNIGNV